MNVSVQFASRRGYCLNAAILLVIASIACSDGVPTQPPPASSIDGNTLKISPSLSATAWTAGGPGTVTLTSDGLTTNPQMTYILSPGYSGTWRFGTTAATSGTVDLGGYTYVGFHSWYQAFAYIRVFILKEDGYEYPLADLQSGPAGDVFSWGGVIPSFEVEAGDYYGLEFGGSHFDGTLVLQGTVTVTLPTSCDAGKYFLGGTGCVDAPAGSYSPGGVVTSATVCPAGTFSSSAGASSCTSAPAGSYATGPGATSAELCAAGYYSANQGQIACDAAPAGSYATGPGATSAQLCAAGHYSANQGQSACDAASAGSFVSAPGATGATTCSAGYYQPSTGSTSCIAAAVGFYVPGAGATSQTACPSGTTTNSIGSTSCIPVYIPPIQVYDALVTLASTTPGVPPGEVTKLTATRKQIGANNSSTCKAIATFMSYVSKQSGKKISVVDANALLLQGQGAKTALGCT